MSVIYSTFQAKYPTVFMGIISRIRKIIEYKGISERKFCKEIGVSNGFLNKVSDVGSAKLMKMLNRYPEINPEWLLMGRGMKLLKNKPISPEAEYNDMMDRYGTEIDNNRGRKMDVYNRFVYSDPKTLKIASEINAFHTETYLLASHIQNYDPYDLVHSVVDEYDRSDGMTFSDVEKRFKEEFKKTKDLYSIIHPYREVLSEIFGKVEEFDKENDRKLSIEESDVLE